MATLLLDQEQEPEIPEIRFPQYEPFEIAVHECRIYNRWKCLVRIIPAKTIGECLAVPMPEDANREKMRALNQWPFSSANKPKAFQGNIV